MFGLSLMVRRLALWSHLQRNRPAAPNTNIGLRVNVLDLRLE